MPDSALPLSEREVEILSLVATGATNQEIACRLVISPNTVKVHLRNIFAKIGVQSRTEASMWAVQRGLIALRPAESTVLPQAESAALTPTVKPIPLWKRIFFGAAAVAVLGLAFLAPAWRGLATVRGATFTAFSDRPTEEDNTAPLAASRWTTRVQMPSPRARLAVAASDGLIFAIAGERGGQITGAVEAYNPAQNLWEIRANKPTPVSNVSAAAINGLIYVPGGTVGSGQPTDTFEVYDTAADHWSTRRPLPQPLCAYALAALNGRLYLFGGWDGARYCDTVYIYDPAKDEWHEGTPMSVPRGFAGAGVVGQKIYLVGGYDERQEYALCDEYDPTREGTGQSPWRPRAPMSIGRGGLAVATVGDMLFAIGGGWQTYLAYNERYDPHSNAWFSFETPITGQWRNLAATSMDIRLYALGGYSQGYLNTNEEYQALYRVILPVRR